MEVESNEQFLIFYHWSMVLSRHRLATGPNPNAVLSSFWQDCAEILWLPGWGGSGFSVLAIDPVANMEVQNGFHMDQLRAFCQRNLLLSEVRFVGPDSLFAGPLAGGVFGLLSYEATFSMERLRAIQTRSLGYPCARFGYFPVVFVHEQATGDWYLSGQLDAYPDLAESLAERFHRQGRVPPAITGESATLTVQVTQEEYSGWVQAARNRIANGDIYQANLAHPIGVRGTESLPALFSRIHSSNPSPWACLVKSPAFSLLSNSPELLLKVEDRQVVAKPIAGTRPRGSDTASDEKHRRNLLRSPKERAEHLMLVDLVRNDLGRVCVPGTVEVPVLMDREPYQNVTHIVSTVVGTLNMGNDELDALAAVFPGGTITGTPKLRSIEVIDSLEAYPRGFYTGSLGYINHSGDMEFNILIRTLQLKESQEGWEGLLHVGAGIVADSNPAREYQETLHKAEAWRRILCG